MPDSSPDDVAQAADTVNTTVETPVDNQASAPDSTADSSPPPAGSMLDAVQAALAPKAESPAASNPEDAAKVDSDAEKPEAADDEDLSQDELKALSWKAQQRFRKLASAAKAKDGEIATLRTKADEHDRIVGAISRAGLDNKELDELVELGSLLKRGDPVVALQKLAPLVRALEQVAGEVLPPELQERVRLGYISEQDARDLNRARAREHFAKQSQERQQRESDAEKQHREITERVNSSVSAIEAWEANQAKSDPDWPSKRQEVADQVELMIAREAQKRKAPFFPNSEEAVKLSKDALKLVNDRIAKFKPRPTEIRPPAAPGVSSRSKPAAKNMLDAINNAL